MDKSQSAPVVEDHERKVPSIEDCKKWIRQDLNSSIYFLSMLNRYPDVLDVAAGELYKHIMSKEHGVLIDQMRGKEAEGG